MASVWGLAWGNAWGDAWGVLSSHRQGGGITYKRKPWEDKKQTISKWLNELIKDLKGETTSLAKIMQVELSIPSFDLSMDDIYITLEKIRKIKLKKKQRQEDDLILFM